MFEDSEYAVPVGSASLTSTGQEVFMPLATTLVQAPVPVQVVSAERRLDTSLEVSIVVPTRR